MKPSTSANPPYGALWAHFGLSTPDSVLGEPARVMRRAALELAESPWTDAQCVGGLGARGNPRGRSVRFAF